MNSKYPRAKEDPNSDDSSPNQKYIRNIYTYKWADALGIN